MRLKLLCGGVLLLLTLLGWTVPAGAEVSYLTSFGSATTSPANPYPLSHPTGVAVNDTTGDVYIGDSENNRVEQFDADGHFLRMWGKDVNVSTGGDICPESPGDVCQVNASAESAGDAAGWFNYPAGVAVDNSNGPAAGSVYVLDVNNNRVQRFTADGHFVLTWGKAVDQQTGENVCTAASHHTCQTGLRSGSPADPGNGIPEVPTEDGVFSGFPLGNAIAGLSVGTGPEGNVFVTDEKLASMVASGRIQKFDPEGNLLGLVSTPPGATGSIPAEIQTPTVAPDGNVTVAIDGSNVCEGCDAYVVQYDAGDFEPGGPQAYRRSYALARDAPRVVADPTNGYLLVLARGCENGSDAPGAHIVEYQPDTTQEVDCTLPESPAVDIAGGMAVSAAPSHRLYLTDRTGIVRVFQLPGSQLPEVVSQAATEITTKGARIATDIVGNLDETTFHVEYGTAGPCSSNPCASTAEVPGIGAALTARPGHTLLKGLQPDTKYYYRVVATNRVGSSPGAGRTFTTFPPPTFSPCENNLARQQTGTAFLLDCRAYELVSAQNQGGYNVESDLVPDQSPYSSYPGAKDKALYAVHDGGIPGAGKPTNRGPDPYLAVRDEAQRRWNTSYVGIPADVGSSAPFSSTVAGASASLSAFAFAGPDICAPCFPGGAGGIPVRLPGGSLVQGMVPAAGFTVPDPTPAGRVDVPLSADGGHLVFGSTQQFAAGGNSDGTNVTIYNRDLVARTTRTVSKLPDTTTIQAGTGVAELGLSADGTRTLIGTLASTDSAGNHYYHLYMQVGASIQSIDLTPGTASGVRYAGMNDAGTRVYFTTRDQFAGDTDTSTDLYLATIGTTSSVLTRISTGIGGTGDTNSCDPFGNSYNEDDWNAIPGGPTDCSVVAIGGGGGVAAGSGTVYFLSPERLDGNGTDGAPNLFLAKPGQPPAFVATLQSSENEPLKPEAHLLRHTVGPFSYPEGVGIDRKDGSVYAFDTLSTSGSDVNEDNAPDYTPGAFVQKFDDQGERDLTFGDNSKLDGSNSISGAFLESGVGYGGSPVGVATQIAVDNSSSGNGAIYVPDFAPLLASSVGGGPVEQSVVDKFSSSGHFISQIPLVNDLPSGVAVNQKNGDVYVSAIGQNRVYTFDKNGFSIPPTSFNVAGPALGIGVDANGNSYVVNGTSTRLYGPTGAFLKVFDSKPSYGVTVDPGADLAGAGDDHVYVDEGDQVVEYDISGNVLETIHLGLNSGSVSLFADQGRLAISHPSSGTVRVYTAPQVPPDSGYDDPLVLDSLRAPATRRTSEFQLTRDGEVAAFQSAAPIDSGFENDAREEVYRRETSSGDLRCVSCSPTEAVPTSDASLASNGSSLTADGRVFFNTGEPLALRDANARRDAYEWSKDAGRAELISSGLGQFDSSLLGVSEDGTDAFFFTREKLAANDDNGNLVRIYDAREDGGFFNIPPAPQCAASDECHGASSQAPPPPTIGTVPGGDGNAIAAKPRKRCAKGKRRPHGHCPKPHSHRKRHNKHATGGSR